jgi:hypothetical protein
MSKSNIYIKRSKRGSFTKAANQRGLGVQQFANKVLSNPNNYSTAMKKKAQFAKNSTKWNKRMYGGELNNMPQYIDYDVLKSGGYAKTPIEYKMGLHLGKNKFKFPFRANHEMTMQPMGMPLSFPVYYQGLTKGKITDQGVAFPGENFSAYGDEVREYPVYQLGGKLWNSYSKGASETYDSVINKGHNLMYNYIPAYRRGVDRENDLQLKYEMLDARARKTAEDLINKYPDSKVSKDFMEKYNISPKKGFLENKIGSPTAQLDYTGASLSNKMQAGGMIYDDSAYGSFDPHAAFYDYEVNDNNKIKNPFKNLNIGDKFKNRKKEDKDIYSVQSHDVPYASLAYNAFRFAEGPDKEKPRLNPMASQAIGKLGDIKYRPNYRPFRTAQNALNEQIRGSSTSVSQMLANKMNAYGKLRDKMADTEMNAANINNEYQKAEAQAMMDFGRTAAAERARVDDLNQRNKAQWWTFAGENARMADDLRSQKRTLNTAKSQNQMTLAGINAKADDIRYIAQPDGTVIEYYRDPVTGKFKPIRYILEE